MVKQFLSLTVLSALLFACSKDELVEKPIFETLNAPSETVSTVVEEHPENTSPPAVAKTNNWIVALQQENGLIESAENTNFVSLYDNALAAILFTKEGNLTKAAKILDFFENKIQLELQDDLGGFYQFRNKEGENGSRKWMGDNAWMLIAIRQYQQESGSLKYNEMAKALEAWLRSLQDEDGGLFGGINADGSSIPKVSEGIITAFNAVPGYDDFHKNILHFLQNNRWIPAENSIVAWPENPAYNHALDLHALSYSIFKNFPEATLAQTERYGNTQIASVTGKEIHGYCFDEDKDVIWLEGTAQLAVAYQQSGNTAKALQLISEIEKTAIASTTFSEAHGIPYTANFGTNFGTNDLWDHADTAPALSSSIWYLFAKMEFNPLSLGKQKDIPSVDQFWKDQSN